MNKFTIEGRLINSDSEVYGQAIIDKDTGLIEEVTEKKGGADITIPDCLIFPGFGDLHIHAREDQSGKWNYKEDFLTTSKAAIHGGVTFALDLTNSFLPLTSEEIYAERKKLAKERGLIDIVLAANIGPGTRPFSFSIPYKIFMSHSVGALFFESKAQLEQTLKNYTGQTINFHCEDSEILAQHASESTHEARRPELAEVKGVEFALEIIKKYSINGKICHVSRRASLEKIIEAKKQGVTVTCEVTPHHLYFDQSMITQTNRTWLQINPALGTVEDRLALIQGLKNGDIDFLASDHAPHTKEEKLNGISGMPGLDTFGLFTTWLMQEHNFSPQDITRVASFNPGQFINPFLNLLSPKNAETNSGQDSGRGFGKIAPGYVGSLTIIDMAHKTLISKENLQTKVKWSAFEGKEFAGSVKYAIIRGRVWDCYRMGFSDEILEFRADSRK